MSLTTNEELDRQYYLSSICIEQEVLDNMFHFLKLREKLAKLYNDNQIEEELKKVWIQNIIIITSSLIESTLQQALLRLKDMYYSGMVLIEDKKFKNTLINENIKMFTYKKLIDISLELGILTSVDERKINKVRQLRNNIHISNNSKDLFDDVRLSVKNLNEMLNLFYDINYSVISFLNGY